MRRHFSGGWAMRFPSVIILLFLLIGAANASVTHFTVAPPSSDGAAFEGSQEFTVVGNFSSNPFPEIELSFSGGIASLPSTNDELTGPFTSGSIFVVTSAGSEIVHFFNNEPDVHADQQNIDVPFVSVVQQFPSFGLIAGVSYEEDSGITFSPLIVTIDAPAGFEVVPFATSVPEPSTWAMLLIGFAGLGFSIPPPSTAFQHRFISQSLMRLVVL
jgi:hypothetical protein